MEGILGFIAPILLFIDSQIILKPVHLHNPQHIYGQGNMDVIHCPEMLKVSLSPK